MTYAGVIIDYTVSSIALSRGDNWLKFSPTDFVLLVNCVR